MKPYAFACFGMLTFLTGLGMNGQLAAAEGTLTIGVLDYRSSEHSLEHWRPTEVALNKALPDQTFRIEPLDLYEMDQALEDGALDFVITNPGNYAGQEFAHHISRIATADKDFPVASTLVTREGLDALTDLRGKRLAIVSPEAFGGFQLIWSEMVDLDSSLMPRVELVLTGYPMRAAADAVVSGEADAAILRACMLEELQARDPEHFGALHAFAVNEAASGEAGCVTSTPVYPGWPFAKTQQTSPELAKRVAVALMQMDAGNFWTVPLDYQPVHDLMRKLKIGPYARTGPVSLRDFITDYRDWLIVMLAALIFWALYSVRIETLVRRRTRTLNETMAALQLEMADRLRAEQADRQHLRELEHVARLSILGEMASSIAHELNQPLSAISSYAQGCMLRIKSGNFSEQDMFLASEQMASQAERAATMVKRIRAFVGKRERQVAAVTPEGLISDCAAIYVASVGRANVSVETEISDGLPVLMVDSIQMQQVILNLVQNSVDAMADLSAEKKRLRITVEPWQDERHGGGVLFSVRDYGCGMKDEQIARFAEPFLTTKKEGIGLGLALSRSIVEAHQGWLRAARPDDGLGGLQVAVWLPEGEQDEQ